MLAGMWFRPRPRALPSGLLWPAPTRPLTADETALATEIFGASLDLGPVRLTRDSVWSLYAPKALGHNVHLKTSWGHFQGPHLRLSAEGRQTLVHELAHVWQHQNGGRAYVYDSAAAQLYALVRHGDRGAAYRWRVALDRGLPWRRWNPEQQASAVERYAVALAAARRGEASPRDREVLALLAPYVALVRRGVGAPRFSLAGALGTGGLAALATVLALGLPRDLPSAAALGLALLLGGLLGSGWRGPRRR